MAKINLRAWREELSAQRQKQFVVNLIASAFLAAVVVFLVGFYIDMQTDRQKTRNNFLRAESAQLDKQLADIKVSCLARWAGCLAMNRCGLQR